MWLFFQIMKMGKKVIEVGQNRTGQVWKEVTGSGFDNVVIDDSGFAAFKVKAGKISVWVPEEKIIEKIITESK